MKKEKQRKVNASRVIARLTMCQFCKLRKEYFFYNMNWSQMLSKFNIFIALEPSPLSAAESILFVLIFKRIYAMYISILRVNFHR